MKYIKYIVWLIAVVAVLSLFLHFVGSLFVTDLTKSGTNNTGQDTLRAAVGKEAPYFNLSKISGGSINRSDLFGAPAVLVFWVTWNESADQIKILDDYKNHPHAVTVRVLAINSQEDRSTVSSFIRRGGYGVDIALDQTGELSGRYGIQTLPTLFFIDKDGIVQDVYTGVISEAMLVDKTENIVR